MSGSFIQKLAGMIFNEQAVKRLANSKLFQKWAMSTQIRVEDTQKKAEAMKEEVDTDKLKADAREYLDGVRNAPKDTAKAFQAAGRVAKANPLLGGVAQWWENLKAEGAAQEQAALEEQLTEKVRKIKTSLGTKKSNAATAATTEPLDGTAAPAANELQSSFEPLVFTSEELQSVFDELAVEQVLDQRRLRLVMEALGDYPTAQELAIVMEDFGSMYSDADEDDEPTLDFEEFEEAWTEKGKLRTQFGAVEANGTITAAQAFHWVSNEMGGKFSMDGTIAVVGMADTQQTGLIDFHAFVAALAAVDAKARVGSDDE